MPRPKSPLAYSQLMWDLAEQMATNTTEIVLALPKGSDAVNLRHDWYAFRKALERNAHLEARYSHLHTALVQWSFIMEPKWTPKKFLTEEEYRFQCSRPTTVIFRHTSDNPLHANLSAQLQSQRPPLASPSSEPTSVTLAPGAFDTFLREHGLSANTHDDDAPLASRSDPEG